MIEPNDIDGAQIRNWRIKMDINSWIGGWELLLIWIVWFMWIPIGGYVARQKCRNVTEGWLFGCLGPFGVLIEALLPTMSARNV